MRAPVASKIALPIAAATTVIAVSPAPLASTSGRLTSTLSIVGTSAPSGRLWNVRQSIDVTFRSSHVTSSPSARLMP